MCGIALILRSHSNPQPEEEKTFLSVDNFIAVLSRRGPDSTGNKKILVSLDNGLSTYSPALASSNVEKKLEDGLSDGRSEKCNGLTDAAELHFIGATLQLRGLNSVSQPLVDTLGNILIYNGEIFGGIHVDVDENDSISILDTLERCSSDKKESGCIADTHLCVPQVLSTVRGPWALIYWQARTNTLWFGRDAFGRRSLVVHWPTFEEPEFVLSSVSPQSTIAISGANLSSGSEPVRELNSDSKGTLSCWDELPCGIHSVHLGALKFDTQGNMQNLVGLLRKHEWTDPILRNLIHWERNDVDPKFTVASQEHSIENGTLRNGTSNPEDYCAGNCANSLLSEQNTSVDCLVPSSFTSKLLPDSGSAWPAHKVLGALKEAVMRRTTSSTLLKRPESVHSVPVAVLFSGGLDSMILAALLDKCLDSKYTIDLLNVSFDGVSAPDRISARNGLKELQKISPTRRWQLVEIDAELSSLTSEKEHVMSLITPANTYMDLNIGMALWLAARGEGFVDGDTKEGLHRATYKSNARILLVGSGADEQCAGYGRHRTKYRAGSWVALNREMKLDMQRIWKRNMGRDDRCISDHGKEARFPFLDEDVIQSLLEMPLWEITNLDEPIGKGDKKILREVAALLGLDGASLLPKRAIQFGSRIARESNKQNFGSNRAANQASAGSVVIDFKSKDVYH